MTSFFHSGKQPRRHVLISGAFGVGKHVAAELIGRLFGLLNNQLVAWVPSAFESLHIAARVWVSFGMVELHTQSNFILCMGTLGVRLDARQASTETVSSHSVSGSANRSDLMLVLRPRYVLAARFDWQPGRIPRIEVQPQSTILRREFLCCGRKEVPKIQSVLDHSTARRGCCEGALLSKNDVGIVTEEMPHGSPEPLKVKGPSGRVGQSWAQGCL